MIAGLLPAVYGDGAHPWPWLGVAALLFGVWFAVVLVLSAATMPRLPDAGPATTLSGPEAPAVAVPRGITFHEFMHRHARVRVGSEYKPYSTAGREPLLMVLGLLDHVLATATPYLPAPIRAALAGDIESGALFVDIFSESTQLYRAYLDEAILLSLAGSLAIVVLMAIALRNPGRLWRVIAPLLVAELLVMAGLALAGAQLTLLHLVGMLLIVAVGSNYALFFDRAEDNPADDPRTLASLLLANVATVIGFGILGLSPVPVLKAIGVTVGPGAVLTLLLSAMLARPHKDRA